MHSSSDGLSVKFANNGVVSLYPSRSLEYNAVDSGLAAAECTLLEWVWLAKNCARVKCRLKEREREREKERERERERGRERERVWLVGWLVS